MSTILCVNHDFFISPGYTGQLNVYEKEIYFDRLNLKSGKAFPDPYEISEDLWTKNPQQIPPLNIFSISNYFVEEINLYSREHFSKSYTSLPSFNIFKSDHVQELQFFFVESYVAIFAEVLPSQRISAKKMYKAYIICNLDGKIVNAHCTCMAG